MPRSKKRNSTKIGARFVVGLLTKVSILRRSQFTKLEAAWNDEVLTLEIAIAAALKTAENTELATLLASRESSKATLDAARRAEVARVKAAWCAEIAKHDAATRAKIAALEAAKKAEIAKHDAATRAEIATLEAAKKAEIAKHDAATRAKIATLEAAKKAEIVLLDAQRRSESTAASLEAQLAERRKSEAYTNHEIKNRLVAMGELCESEAPLDQIMALIQETIETIVRRNTFRFLATGTYSPSPEQIDLSKFIQQRVFRFRPAGRHVDVMPTKGDAKSCDALLLDPLLIGIIVDNLSSKNSVSVFAPSRILRRLKGLWSLRTLLESLHSTP
jgi:anti-sigma factor ChrR (cupin superfamily)